MDADEYIRAISGGYPEARGLRSQIARTAWYDGYLTTVINRDIRTSPRSARLAQSPAAGPGRRARRVAAGGGRPCVVGRPCRATVRNYLTYLDTVFLTTECWPGRRISTPAVEDA